MTKLKVALYWCASCGGCEGAVVDLAVGRVRGVDVMAAEAIRKGDYAVDRIDRRSAFEKLWMIREMAMCSAEEDGRSVEEASRPFDVRLKGLSGEISS